MNHQMIRDVSYTNITSYIRTMIILWLYKKYRLQVGRWRIGEYLENILLREEKTKILIRTHAGFSMKLNPKDLIQRTILIEGEWEKDIQKVLTQYLRPGDTFIDIGANVGYFTLYAASIVSDTGRVIAFEPHPHVFQHLDNNIKENNFSCVEAYQIGLTDKDGQENFHLGPISNLGASSLVERPESRQSITINVRSASSIFRELKIKDCKIIKIDSEGAEYKIINGMSECLPEIGWPDIICEVSEYSLCKMGNSKSDLFNIFSSLGYTPKLISNISLSKFSQQELYFQYDVLFEKDINSESVG